MAEGVLREIRSLTGNSFCQVGTAELSSPALADACSRGGIDFSSLRFAVAIAAPFPAEVINQLRQGPSRTYLYHYRVVNAQLDRLMLEISSCLEEAGGQAFPIPSSQRTGNRFQSIFPHRTAARAAGLGWIGRSSNLIVPGRGPRIRLGTVLTNLPLPPGQVRENGCGDCQACREACPPGAIKGPAFEPGDPQEKRFDPQACNDYKNRVRDHFGKRVCGICLAVCPQGREELTITGRDNQHPPVPPEQKAQEDRRPD